jgi:hypothetical protein
LGAQILPQRQISTKKTDFPPRTGVLLVAVNPVRVTGL